MSDIKGFINDTDGYIIMVWRMVLNEEQQQQELKQLLKS